MKNYSLGKKCLDCGKNKSDRGNYCKKCGYKYRVRPKGLKYKIVVVNKGWFENKGGWIDESGYRKIRINGKQIREHVYILEKHLGRKLLKSEVSHHINGDKLDNRIENLQVVSKKKHDKFHHYKFRKGLII